MNDEEATRVVQGLVFAVQKARSDLAEAMGDSEASKAVMAELSPWLFGPKCVLPPLLKWQQGCEKSGVIEGLALLNFVRLLEMKEPMLLGLLPLWGYPAPEPEPAWAVRAWRWVA